MKHKDPAIVYPAVHEYCKILLAHWLTVRLFVSGGILYKYIKTHCLAGCVHGFQSPDKIDVGGERIEKYPCIIHITIKKYTLPPN